MTLLAPSRRDKTERPPQRERKSAWTSTPPENKRGDRPGDGYNSPPAPEALPCPRESLTGIVHAAPAPTFPSRAIGSVRFYSSERADSIARYHLALASDTFCALVQVEPHGFYRSRGKRGAGTNLAQDGIKPGPPPFRSRGNFGQVLRRSVAAKAKNESRPNASPRPTCCFSWSGRRESAWHLSAPGNRCGAARLARYAGNRLRVSSASRP